MSTADNRCSRARAAAKEVVMNECEDDDGEMVEVTDDVFVFVREDEFDDIDVDLPGETPDDDDRESAIEECMGSEWARKYADSTVSPDADEELKEQVKRNACEGLVG